MVWCMACYYGIHNSLSIFPQKSHSSFHYHQQNQQACQFPWPQDRTWAACPRDPSVSWTRRSHPWPPALRSPRSTILAPRSRSRCCWNSCGRPRTAYPTARPSHRCPGRPRGSRTARSARRPSWSWLMRPGAEATWRGRLRGTRGRRRGGARRHPGSPDRGLVVAGGRPGTAPGLCSRLPCEGRWEMIRCDKKGVCSMWYIIWNARKKMLYSKDNASQIALNSSFECQRMTVLYTEFPWTN